MNVVTARGQLVRERFSVRANTGAEGIRGVLDRHQGKAERWLTLIWHHDLVLPGIAHNGLEKYQAAQYRPEQVKEIIGEQSPGKHR